MRFGSPRLIAPGLAALASLLVSVESRAGYTVTNLVSDIAGLAATTDPNLKNPWGVSSAPGGPFWVSDQGSNKSTLYSGTGSIIPLVVSIPTEAAPPNGPTGQVFNGNASDFLINGASSHFLFANLNGDISGWSGGGAATNAVTGTGAVYTGMAIAQVGSDNVLFAADARGDKVDVYSSTFQNLNGSTYAGAFHDPNLASGFRIFNIQAIGNVLFVTYDNGAGGTTGTNGGVVAEFGLDGHFIKELSSNGPGGPLEDPWGVVKASANFGQFSNDILVGNKENGQINAFDPNTGAFLGLVATITNDPTSSNNGLWGLSFGTGGAGSSVDTLYAFAGINNEADGLMAAVQVGAAVPEPGSAALVLIGGAFAFAAARRRRRPA